MSNQSVIMARVYLTEKDHQLQKVISCLHDDLKVRGVTVLRGIAGFGASGKIHHSSLLDMSLDLPLVVEFFDTPDKVRLALAKIHDFVGPGHVVTWPAELNMGDR
jgi:PII-like signaling protein